MPIDLDDNLVNAAIIEFHTARDNGRSDSQAWNAAVERVRYDVLTMAAVICEQVAQGLMEADGSGAAGAHACAVAIRDFL